ncbi:MAG: Clp protease ClpP [Eubacteriales bacterium]
MPNKYWNFIVDEANPQEVNLYVNGVIKANHTFLDKKGTAADDFIADLNKHADAQIINVHINSPGGSVFAAASMVNQLRKHSAVINTYGDGMIASAAVGLLQAADAGHRYMSDATLLMVHNPSTKVQGQHSDLVKAADVLMKTKDTLINLYAPTGLSRAKLSSMMDEETYLTAVEAKAYNFIDAITEEEVAYSFDEENHVICNDSIFALDVVAHVDLDKFQDHIKQLNITKNQEGGYKNMTFEDYINSLDESQVDDVRNMINAHCANAVQTASEESVAEITALQGQITDLSTKNTALTDEIATLQAAAAPAIDPLASLPEEARNMIAQAQASAIQAQKALEEIQAEKAFADFKAEFAIYDNLPIEDVHIKAIQQLSNSNEDLYTNLCELLKVANNAMGQTFVPTGSAGVDVPTDSLSALESAIATYTAANVGANYETAMKAVLRENPALYENYRAAQLGM